MIFFLFIDLFFIPGSLKSDNLQYGVVPLIDNTKCIKPHTIFDSFLVTSNMNCAGNVQAGEAGFVSPCFSDAGASLVVPDSSNDDLAVVIGLVSWGAGCAYNTAVYTRITPFVGWIRGYMKGMNLYS